MVGTILFTVALVATAAFVFVLFADAQNIDEVPGVGEVSTAALVVVIGLSVLALVLFILILMRQWSRNEGEFDIGQALVQFEPADAPIVSVDEPAGTGEFRQAKPLRTGIVPLDLAGVPIGARCWGPSEDGAGGQIFPYHFPRPARNAVYTNDYIDIGAGNVLRLRTLLAAPAGSFRGAVEERPGPAKIRHGDEGKQGGDDFMRRLEERYEARKDGNGTVQVETEGTKAEAYYDYTGDVHPVIDVEGIGEEYARKLTEAGIETTARLCYEDAGNLSRVTGAPKKTVEAWQSMAELMKVSGIGKQYAEALARAGIMGVAELKRRSAQVIADQVNEYLDGLETNVLGTNITARRVEGWKAAASTMRRVRMTIPEK